MKRSAEKLGQEMGSVIFSSWDLFFFHVTDAGVHRATSLLRAYGGERFASCTNITVEELHGIQTTQYLQLIEKG